jgi:hypothetical protein
MNAIFCHPGLCRLLILGLLLTLFPLRSVLALEIEGVKVPETAVVEGNHLTLNGAGLREIRILGAKIKLYVASFYAPIRVHTLDEALASPRPLEINFTFLKGISHGLVESSWRQQFANNATFTYPGFHRDQETFLRLLGSLDERGKDTVQFVGEETRVLDQGKLMGVIRGGDFQRAFLSLLFGTKPISRKLKSSLLGVSSVPR